MKGTMRKGLVYWAAAAALLGMAWITTACGGTTIPMTGALTGCDRRKPNAAPRPASGPSSRRTSTSGR